MTAEIINLRHARKQKARQEKQRQASSNRALHGETKEHRAARRDGDQRIRHHLDQSLREGATAGTAAQAGKTTAQAPVGPEPAAAKGTPPTDDEMGT